MNEITGASGPATHRDIAASQRAARLAGRGDGADSSRRLERGDDGEFSAEAIAMAKASGLPDVRTEVVNRVLAEINDPDYDLDGKLAKALDRMLDDAFGA